MEDNSLVILLEPASVDGRTSAAVGLIANRLERGSSAVGRSSGRAIGEEAEQAIGNGAESLAEPI